MKASSVYVVLGILSVSYFSAITKPGEYDVRLFVVNTDYWVILVFVCFPYQVLILLEKKFIKLPERCT